MDAPDQREPTGKTGVEPALARYRLPQNAAAIAGSVPVKNDRGELGFEIDRGARATDDVVRVLDAREPATCLIWGHALRSTESIEIVDAKGTPLASIARVEVSPVRDRFLVHQDALTTWTIDGNVAKYEYQMQGQTEEIGEVSRRWFRARDSYGVQVAAGQPDLLVVTVAICLDLIMHGGG